VEDRADDIARLIVHLLANTQPTFWEGHYLANIVPRLGSIDPAQRDLLVEHGLRLNIPEAAKW
jgi:hypothetical protein